MKIKLQEALDLVASADVVKLDYCIRPNVDFAEITGEPDNQVMFLTWEEDDQEYAIKVPESDNLEVERDGHKLTFTDEEGEPFEIHLFHEVPISS